MTWPACLAYSISYVANNYKSISDGIRMARVFICPLIQSAR